MAAQDDSKQSNEKLKYTGPGPVRLSPPWWTLYRKVKGLLGDADKDVTVSKLQDSTSEMSITLSVSGDSAKVKAVGLATIMTQISFGNIKIKFIVKLSDGTLIDPIVPKDTKELQACVNDALKGNNYFVDSYIRDRFTNSPAVWPVFTPSILQFWNDNLADYYSNYNGVVAQGFGDILASQVNNIPLLCSTQQLLTNDPKNKDKDKAKGDSKEKDGKNESLVLDYIGMVVIGDRIVKKSYPNAVLLESSGYTTDGVYTTDPRGISSMRVVFSVTDGTVIIKSVAWGEFGEPQFIPVPWLEDLPIQLSDKMITLEKANQLKEKAGYKDGYNIVTLRRPLYKEVYPNAFYIFCQKDKYVFVDTITGEVTVPK